MKRMLIGLATAAGLSLCAGVASADPGGYAPPGGARATGIPGMGQIGGPNTLLGAGDLPPGRGPDKYGLHPKLKKLFHITPNPGGYGTWGAHGGYAGGPGPWAGGPYGGPGPNPLSNPANWAAGGYGQGGPAYSPNGFPPGAYGPQAPMMQGTLAFPHHTFVRSPRDYFMVDVNK